MQYIYMNSSYEIFFHNVRKTLFSTFHRLFNTHFRTMKMVTTNLKADKTNMALLSELLGVSPLGLKNLEKERMTLRFYKPLMTQVKRVAEAKNISVNLYLEQAVVEKLKMDSLSAELRDEVDTYSLLKNKNIDEIAYLKKLLTQTLQDNNRLKKAVEKYRSTNNGMEFESFELF